MTHPANSPRALLTSLLVLALSAPGLASCGSSEKLSTHTLLAPQAAKREPPSNLTEASIRTSIALCKRAVRNARTVPASARSELLFACSKVVDRSGKEAQELRQGLCEELEHASSSRVASVREQVLRACEVESTG